MKEDPIKNLVDLWGNWLEANDKALNGDTESAIEAENLISTRYKIIDQIDREVDRRVKEKINE